MAQVLTGNNAFSFTNNTGQNVRVIIGYLDVTFPAGAQASSVSASFPGATIQHNPSGGGLIIGKNLPHNTTGFAQVMPNEIYLSSGQTITISISYIDSATGNFVSSGAVKYNVLIIPEAG
jgi:hypothetical protein